MNILALLVMLILAGTEVHCKTMELMTRSSDGAALCSLDPPALSTGLSPRLPGAPEAVRCGMMCHEDGDCKQFNYISTMSSPCQLYRYKPTNFDISPNCQHFYHSGQQNILHTPSSKFSIVL